MNKVVRVAKFAFLNFGPLIVFYTVNHFYGMRAAVAGAVLVGLVEVVYQLAKKEKITGLFKCTMLVTLIFGALDLTMRSPVFFKYESVFTNIIVGIYFGITIRAPKTVIQEFMEKRNGEDMVDRNAIFRCRVFTIVWTVYFFLKAGLYAYVTHQYSLEKALIIRSTLGTISFYGLLGVSLFFGRRIIVYFQEKGLLRIYPEVGIA